MTEHMEQLQEHAYGLPIMRQLDELAQTWRDGNIDALAFYITLARLEKQISELKDEVKPYAIEQSGQWHEKQFSYFGATIEKRAAAGKWDFSNISAWKGLKEHLKAVEERAKAAYQAAQKFGMQTATQDGEEIELPAYVSGGEIIAIKGL